MTDTNPSDLLVLNPLPWERTISGTVSQYIVDTRGDQSDQTAGRHFQDRSLGRRTISGFVNSEETDPETESYLLPPTTVPAYGYGRVSVDDLVLDSDWPFDERGTLETARYRVEFDRQSGGISRLVDRELSHEWVDRTANSSLGGFVHERVADEATPRPRRLLFRYPDRGVDPHDAVTGAVDDHRGFQPDWHARRTRPERVVRHRVHETPIGYDVRQRLSVEHLSGEVSLRLLFPHDSTSIIVEAQWTMEMESHPESTYLTFPLNLSDPEVTLDVGGQAMRPGRDQLPGTCRDFYTVQRWVDFNDGERGMTIGCPINPLVQLGSFTLGENKSTADIEQAHLLGWVTNNFWDTNFRAYQPGRVRARYHLRPYEGNFDESTAHAFGMEAEHWEPVAQTMGERSAQSPTLPAVGTLLSLPDPPTLVLHVRPTAGNCGVYPCPSDAAAVSSESTDADVAVLLKNASDESQNASFDSGVLAIEGARTATVLGERPTDERIQRTDDGIMIELNAREMRLVLLTLGSADSEGVVG